MTATPPDEPPKVWRESRRSEVSFFSLFAWMVGGCGLFNFIILPVLRATERGNDAAAIFFVSLAAGVYAAELGAMTIWLVFGHGPFWRRLLIHTVVGFGLYAAWAIGFGAAFGSSGPPGGVAEVWRVILCGLPPVSLAAQLPLWTLRIYFGWRIEPTAAHQVVATPQPLMIRDLFAGMIVTGISLTALRLMPTDFLRSPDFWLGWSGAFVTIATISALSLLPALRFLLRIQETPAAATVWFGYAGVMWIIMLVVASFLSSPRGPPGEVVGATLIVFYTFAAALSVPLFILRARGYRLVFPRIVARQTFSSLTHSDHGQP